MAEIEDLKIVGGSTYTVGNQDIIANEWEAGKTYVKGKSYVIREHRLYVCNVTHTSVEPFDATKWTEITVGEAIAANTTAIGDLSQLTTSVKSSLVGAVNELNNLPRPSVTLASVRSDVQIWNTSLVVNQRSGTINTFFLFKNNSTANPTITHKINCSRSISGLRLVAYCPLLDRSTDATYDAQTGNIVWGTGLPSGVWLVMGTVSYS